MDRPQGFWDSVRERWRARDPGEEREAVHAVLIHLRRRLSGPEFEHLGAELPEAVRALWAEPEIEEKRQGGRPLEKMDFGQFLTIVKEEAGLPDLAEAERATAAVFHALGRYLDDKEKAHVANLLPGGLQERWLDETGIPGPSQTQMSHAPGSATRRTSRRPGGGKTARRSTESRGSRSWSRRN